MISRSELLKRTFRNAPLVSGVLHLSALFLHECAFSLKDVIQAIKETAFVTSEYTEFKDVIRGRGAVDEWKGRRTIKSNH